MRLPGQRLEPQRVHLAIADPQHVSGVLGDQHLGGGAGLAAGFEHPPQLGDVSLHRGNGSRGRLVPPQQIDQPVHRDDLPGLHHQDRQQRALHPRAGVEFTPAPNHPERAQQPKVQAAVAGHLGHRSPPITQV